MPYRAKSVFKVDLKTPLIFGKDAGFQGPNPLSFRDPDKLFQEGCADPQATLAAAHINADFGYARISATGRNWTQRRPAHYLAPLDSHQAAVSQMSGFPGFPIRSFGFESCQARRDPFQIDFAYLWPMAFFKSLEKNFASQSEYSSRGRMQDTKDAGYRILRPSHLVLRGFFPQLTVLLWALAQGGL